MPQSNSITTIKEPGDLVLGTNGKLFRIDDDGHEQPYETEHSRRVRERAEAFRARHMPTLLRAAN